MSSDFYTDALFLGTKRFLLPLLPFVLSIELLVERGLILNNNTLFAMLK